MSQVRLGAIIGFGNVAANGHLPGWREHPDFSIVAVVDPDAERRNAACQMLPGVGAYATIGELLASEQLDFVDIAAPPALHAAAIEAAAAAGVHVLCEKPLTTSISEYRRIQAAVQGAGTVLHTVHNWKYSEAFLAVSALVRDGLLGPLRSVSFETERNGCAAATGDNWRMDRAVGGGGILVDHGWHAFYLMLALAGERPLRIRAQLEKRRYPEASVEDTAQCVVDFPSLRGQIHLTWAADSRRTCWTVRGDHGEVIVDDDRLLVRGRDGSRQQPLRSALSAGSHHPDWFGGVVTEFRAALDDRAQGSANQVEAGLCVLMLEQAYASSALQARPMDIPSVDASGCEVAA